MRFTRRRLFAAVAVSALFAWTGRTDAEILSATETSISITTSYPSYLVTFNTNNPGTLLSTVQFGGADIGTPASGNPNGAQFVVAGIDFQPSTFQLYGMGLRGGIIQRVYNINPNTGIATGVSGPFISSNSASFNFDPVRNVIRVESDQGQNNHIAPATGNATVDTNLAYAAGDPNAGITPIVANAAYTNHAGSPASTTLYGIDARGHGTLVQIGTAGNAASADGGQLHTVGPLNLSFNIPSQAHLGFFISASTGNAYAAIQAPTNFNAGADNGSELFSINLATGAATDLGAIGLVPDPNGITVYGLTAIPEPGSLALVGTALLGALGYARRRRAARAT